MSDAPTLPEPLVPAEVDLRDFAFMPLDVQRLRDSDLASDETPEACWAAVLLWCASWHQVPAASIPDNDQWQAKQCGYVAQGKVAPGWKRARAGALRHWLLCSDGRLYHPVVAEKALDAWRSKLHQRWKTEAARIKKHNQRHNLGPQDATPIPEFDDWIASGCPQGHALYVPEDKRPMSPGSPQEIDSKRQGQGQGQGKEEIPPVAPQGADAPPGFARFWEAWPRSDRKGGKPVCLKAWQRGKLEPEADAIVAHVEAMKATAKWRENGGEFVPMPSTYLNQRRWDGAELNGHDQVDDRYAGAL